MEPLIADQLQSDPRVAQARALLHQALADARARLTAIKPADPARKVTYDQTIAHFAKSRGGQLFYPYLGSGVGNGALVELADGSVKLDLISGIGVHYFGHSAPLLLDASIDAALRDTVMQGNLQQNVESDRLAQTLSRAMKWQAERVRNAEPLTASPAASKPALQRTKVLVKSQGRNFICDAQDIIYATIDDGLITVVTTGFEGISNYRTIEELQSNLDPDLFWRVHRSLYRVLGPRVLWTPQSKRGWGALHLTTTGRASGRPRWLRRRAGRHLSRCRRHHPRACRAHRTEQPGRPRDGLRPGRTRRRGLLRRRSGRLPGRRGANADRAGADAHRIVSSVGTRSGPAERKGDACTGIR